MKKLWLIVPIIIVVAFGAALFLRPKASDYVNTRDIEGDWIIDDYQEITDSIVNIEGSIIVEGEGHLVVRNSYLHFLQDYNNEYKVQMGSGEAEGVQ